MIKENSEKSWVYAMPIPSLAIGFYAPGLSTTTVLFETYCFRRARRGES